MRSASTALRSVCPSRATALSATVYRPARTSTAILLGLLAAGVWVAAHEGHDGALVKPVYQQVQAGGATYRVGFVMQPTDVLVGEDVRFDLQILQLLDPPSNGGVGGPVAGDMQVRIISAGAAPYPVAHVSPGGKPGAYSVLHRFEDSGQYGIAPSLQSGPNTITAEFPVVVVAGPVARTTLVVDAIVLLVLGALVFSRWRGRKDASPETPARLGPDAALAAVGVAVLVAGHLWVAPAVGRRFLPERHVGPVAWDTGPPPSGAPGAEPHEHAPGTPPHGHGEETPAHVDPPGTPPHSHSGDASPAPSAAPLDAREIVSTVVPMPGQLAEVVVPMSARILFDGFTPQVGRTVRRGQTLATLEPQYVLHDAVHLINQRWLYIVPMLTRQRERLAAELNAARLRHLQRTGDASVKQMMEITQAVQTAELAAKTATLEQDKAVKLLAMHDAQITKSDLQRRPVVSPIDGTIEAVNFTQGQLAYENDKLFTILDLSRVRIEARFPAGSATSQPPSRMTFVSPAFPAKRFEGRLARVANTLDPQTGTLSAFFEVPNADRLLRVGMRLAAQPSTGDAPVAVGTTADVVRRAVATRDADPGAPAASLTAVVKPKPELTAVVTAPLWGRIEFAGRRLSVGDRVTKGENIVNVILELSVDERYLMNARAVEIASELEMAKVRRAQAEQQWRQAVLKADKADAFRQEEAEILQRIYRGAQAEETLLTRQAEVYKGTIKSRDPKTTLVQAPISGVITEIGFTPGELNQTDEFHHLVTIVDTTRVWLEAKVYDYQSAAILQGFRRASFTSPGLPSPRSLDRPVAVSGAVNPETGALTAVFDVPNPGGALKIGAFAQIAVPRD